MEEEIKPYEKYGVAELLNVHELRKKILEIENVKHISELMYVVSACNDFEMGWKMQVEPLAFEKGTRKMDKAVAYLRSKHLFE